MTMATMGGTAYVDEMIPMRCSEQEVQLLL